ncbi:hypothetical protein Pla52n_12680 [Stieleria varia]|uniref:Uncharacterized protein n=1 Tax=Stieleria varia TaxID=2528005 RepID=A0A5C6B4Z6_9BACT|nr:hypothetical protein Pla52n_12680 [Stieleria varia]
MLLNAFGVSSKWSNKTGQWKLPVKTNALTAQAYAGLFKIRGCGTMAFREFLSPLPAQLVAPSEPQALAVGLRRIVVPAHG